MIVQEDFAQASFGVRLVPAIRKSKSYRMSLLFLFIAALFSIADQAQAKTDNPQRPQEEYKKYVQQTANEDKQHADKYDQQVKADTQPGSGRGSQFSYGMGMSETPTQMAMMKLSDGGSGGGSGMASGMTCMMENLAGMNHLTNFQFATTERPCGGYAGSDYAKMSRPLTVNKVGIGRISDDIAAMYPYAKVAGSKGAPGRPPMIADIARAAGRSANVEAQAKSAPEGKSNQSKCGNSGNQCSSASSAGEDTLECMINALDGMTLNLINVANEDAGSPCSSDQVSKTYANAVWMVMKMYKACFLPMAVLFLLPGALITNTKTMVSFGILHNGNDEDSTNPFAGIMRSVIAIFLIPATQMIVSYMVDVGNSLQYSCQPYVNIPIIVLWAQEQVQIFKPDQQGNGIKNLPNVAMAPWRGKFAGMPQAGAILEQVSGLDAALSELANECCHILTEGLTIAYAFQLATLCYLFLLGPIAAAFFAWPSGIGKDLFRKAFSSWVDGVVLVSLWKFWWNVLLICMTVRCESGALNPFDVMEVYYLVAFLCIMMVVPFNPFDFKPGEIVSKALEKAQAVASKVAEAGKAGGSGKGGKASPGAG